MRVDRDVAVTMRDGARLAADVYRPDDDGRHPVLLQRTPYGKAHPLYLHATGIDLVGAVERGYAVVSQDCRGRFASEGDWRPFRHEAADGYDTVEWVAEQPWCDGNVGIWGCSYMGTTALQAAVAAPPHLRAVLAYMAGPSPHQGWAFTGGAFELGFATFWTTRGAWETLRRLDVDDDRRAELGRLLHDRTSRPPRDITRLPICELDGLEELIPFWREWLDHPRLDDYWLAVDVPARADAIRVPVLHITGVGDNFLGGHLALERALAQHPDQTVRSSHRFMLGPWDHESYQTSRPSASGQIDFGPQARNGFALNDPVSRSWFDHWLLGAERPLMRTPPVRFFCTGEDGWRYAQRWPPPGETVELHLKSRGRANGRHGDGTLDGEPAGSGSDVADSFTYDPRSPVPSAGGRMLSPVFAPAGVHDQSEVEAREDVLVYTGPPLDRPLVAAGDATLVLWVSTTGEDTDFTAKLVDVEPDGYCRNVAEGIVRLSRREDDAAAVRPGEALAISIDLGAVAHAFRTGHRIRVHVTSSDFTHFDRNLNVAESPEHAGGELARVTRQTVFHDRERPSRLCLPVLHEGAA